MSFTINIPVGGKEVDFNEYIEEIYSHQITYVHSFTGSGKTSRLICKLIEDYASFHKVLVLTPTKTLVEATYETLVKCDTKRSIGRQHSSSNEQGDVIVSTYGKYVSNMLNETQKPYDLIICDEYHTGDADVQFLVEYFKYTVHRIYQLYKLNNLPVLYEGVKYTYPLKVCLLSATPLGFIVPRTIRYPITEHTIKPKGQKYNITKEGLYFYGNLTILSNYIRGAIIHCVSIRETQELAAKWNIKCKTQAFSLSSETSIDDFKHIQEVLPECVVFSTDTIKSGITLDAESIVLPGISMKPTLIFEEQEDQSVHTSIRLSQHISNEADFHQFESRVGRTRPGIVYKANIKYSKYDRWEQSELRVMLLFAWFDIPIPEDFKIYTTVVKRNWFKYETEQLIKTLNRRKCVRML